MTERQVPTYQELKRRLAAAEAELQLLRTQDNNIPGIKAEETPEISLQQLKYEKKLIKSFFESSSKVLELGSFEETARHIFNAACALTGAKSGYVALLNNVGDENEVLFLESGSLPCTVDESLPMPIRGLRSEAYKTQRAVYDNSFMNSKWASFMPEGHVALQNVMFAPLNLQGETVGIMGLANKPEPFTDADVSVAEAFGQLAAMALQNSRNLEAQRESEQYLRNILVNIPLIGITLDTKGRIVFANNHFLQLTGWHEDEILGRDWFDICIPENAREIVLNVFKQLLGSGNTRDLSSRENPILTKFGERRTIGWFNVINRDPNGAIVDITCLGIDLTERKKAEEERVKLQQQLSHAQKMESVGRLAGGVAHDFNNMLNVILGNSEFLLEEYPEKGLAQESVIEIQKAARRSADLTRHLLAFARKQTVTPQVLHLNETIESMINMLRRLVGENIKVIWKPSEKIQPIRIDPAQIDQILANLVVNARDAIGGKTGTITIETSSDDIDQAFCGAHPDITPGKYVTFSVTDNGCGMDEKTRQHIFEPFFTTKGIGEGTGLGLSTVYGIVRQNNGIINVCSQLGRGTTFHIYLPVYKDNLESTSREKSVKKVLESGNETILLVEDEPSILKMTTKMLGRMGYEVIAADTPNKAIQLAEEHEGKIDLLLTDVVMPEMNGRDLSRKILALYPDIRRLFMSGYTADIIASQGMVDEGMEYIQKPFSKKELEKKIRKILDA